MIFKSLRNVPWDPEVPLTAEGGPMDQGETFRAIAALYQDGRFLVSKSHVRNPQIISFIEEIKLDGFETIDIRPVDIGTVAAAYEESRVGIRVTGQKDSARMRREVLELIGNLSKKAHVGYSYCRWRVFLFGARAYRWQHAAYC
jgi:hypothetical protein